MKKNLLKMTLVAMLSMFTTMSFAQTLSFDEAVVAPGEESVVKVYVEGAIEGCSGVGFRVIGLPETVTVKTAELNKDVFTDAGATVTYNYNTRKALYQMNYSNNNKACAITSAKTEMGSFTLAATEAAEKGEVTLDIQVVVFPNEDSSKNGTADNMTLTLTIGEATGINEVSAQNVNAPIYSIAGARMNGNLTKGIYVQNGKKFIVK